MAKKENSPNPIPRIIFFVMIWAAFLFFTLATISFSAGDWPNPMVYGGPVREYHNFGGKIGAAMAYVALQHIGPGVFVAIVMAGIGLVQWSRQKPIPQLPLRLVGTFMMVAAVSTIFTLCGGERSGDLPNGPGGALGVGMGNFFWLHFKHGSWLILLPTLIIGALLAADEFVLALPARLLWTWKRVPTESIAGVATGAAGGMWSSIKGFVGAIGHRDMGKVEKTRKLRKNPDEAAKPQGGPEVATELKNPREETPEEIPAAAVATPEPEVSNEEKEALAKEAAATPAPAEPNEPIIRKPMPAKLLKAPLPLAPKQDLGNYRMPGLDLLDEAEPINPEGQEQRIREKSRVLEQTLTSYDIEGKVEAIDTGPVVTLYELGLAPGIKSSQVAALSKDIARALKSPPIRIIDNIPGKSTMGVEVPNLDRERVRLKELFQLGGDVINKMNLPMCLGKDASGNPMIEDLTRMPHMLIAGTTGSGKSVCINSIIMTFLLTQRPDHVKLILVDPKMVEMQDYKSIPHLMAPIIDDMSKAESILEWATHKMDERYEIMSEANVRNIRDYNKLTREEIVARFNATTDDDKAKLVFHMPYIVIIIDELADLMMTSKDVEGHIVRIAQKARAVGIHLILATQRPEAQVVTGLIKSNMPGRICFQVRSRLDSRIMLDQAGGELLLGQGDLMMLKPTGGGLIRAQGAFVDDKEIRAVCKFLKDIAEPEFHPELMQLGTSGGLAEGEEKDPLYNDAVDIMIESGRGSVSLIQRRLNIGYSRASRIIDQLRRTGIVGAYKGSMASEVTLTKEEWEAMKAEMGGGSTSIAADADPTIEGNTGTDAGRGKHTGYAQQYGSNYDGPADDDENGVPDEMPGEHRL